MGTVEEQLVEVYRVAEELGELSDRLRNSIDNAILTLNGTGPTDGDPPHDAPDQ